LGAGFYFFIGYGVDLPIVFLLEGAGMSEKSPRGANNKKQGKSVKEKRADKRAKAATEEFLPKRRKDAR
jgi:hypothetical protein